MQSAWPTTSTLLDRLRFDGRLDGLWETSPAVRYRDPGTRLMQCWPDISRHTSPNGPDVNPNPLFSSAAVWVPSHSDAVAGGTVLNGDGTVTLNSNNSGNIQATIPCTASVPYLIAVPVTTIGNTSVTITLGDGGSGGAGFGANAISAVNGTRYFIVFPLGTSFTIRLQSASAQATPATVGTVTIKQWDGLHLIQPTLASRPLATKHGVYTDGVDDFMVAYPVPFSSAGSATGTCFVLGGINHNGSSAGVHLYAYKDASNWAYLMCQNNEGNGTIFSGSMIASDFDAGENDRTTWLQNRWQLSENAAVSGSPNQGLRDGLVVAKMPSTPDARWFDDFHAAGFTNLYFGKAAHDNTALLKGVTKSMALVADINYVATPTEATQIRSYMTSRDVTSSAGAITRLSDEVTVTGTQETILNTLRAGWQSDNTDSNIIDASLMMFDLEKPNSLWLKSGLCSFFKGGTTTHASRKIAFSSNGYMVSPYNGNSLIAKGWTHAKHGFWFSRTNAASNADQWDAGTLYRSWGSANSTATGARFGSNADDLNEGSLKASNPAGIYYFARVGTRMRIYFYNGSGFVTLANKTNASASGGLLDCLFTLGCWTFQDATQFLTGGFTNAEYRSMGFVIPKDDATEDATMAQAIMSRLWTAEEAMAAT